MKVKAILVHNYFQPFKDPVSILAKLIQAFCGHWNHVEVLIDEGDGHPYLIGAVFPRVRKVDFDTWEKSLNREYIIMNITTDRSPEAMIEYANSQVGTRYDRDSLLLFMPFYLLGKYWFGKRTWIGHRGPKAKASSYCFELLANTAGWDECYNITPREVIKNLY